MRTWTEFLWSTRLLEAARIVARVIGSEGRHLDEVHRTWLDLPANLGVDLLDLDAVESELLRIGLIEETGKVLRAAEPLIVASQASEDVGDEVLLALLLECSPPLWLRTAAGKWADLSSELIPDSVLSGLSGILPDPERREAFLLERARVVETTALSALGELGEEAVVSHCRHQLAELGRDDLADRVSRVSLISDELGYDVTAPRIDGSTRRLEVKTTRGEGSRLAIYLSRNEATVGLSDHDWALVIVAASRGLEATIVGWIEASRLLPYFPADQHEQGRWQSARLTIPTSQLMLGLPSAVARGD